jgi:FkbM family methyltransferase
MAKRTVANKEVDNISINNIGVFSKKAVHCFTNDGSQGNRIVNEGGIKIPVDSLDNLLRERPHPVTFIKMDIEGAEMEALLGAHEIITADAPKLAISVYHKFGDIWEIPYYILTNFPGYKIYLRNEYAFCDNICFAVKD